MEVEKEEEEEEEEGVWAAGSTEVAPGESYLFNELEAHPMPWKRLCADE